MPISMFPNSPYSISKLIGEMYGNYYFERYSMPFVKARFRAFTALEKYWEHGVVLILPFGKCDSYICMKSLSEERLPLENSGETTRDLFLLKILS